MLKDRLASLIGKENYVNHVMHWTKVYHAFFKIRHPATAVMKELLIPKGGTILDIGAHIGVFTTFAAKQVGPSGKVYSFEPVPMVLRVLRRVVTLRRFRQVTVIDSALADKPGTFDMTIPLKDGWKPMLPLAHFGKSSGAGALQVKIKTQRLDDVCVAQNIAKIDFIKCDTEGGEFSVFSGGLECLAKDLPSVVCEIYEDYLRRQGVTPPQVFGIFKSLGYGCYTPNSEGGLSRVEDYVKPTDYLFIHPARIDTERLKPFLA